MPFTNELISKSFKQFLLAGFGCLTKDAARHHPIDTLDSIDTHIFGQNQVRHVVSLSQKVVTIQALQGELVGVDVPLSIRFAGRQTV